jgi:hypothetical protein
MADLVDLVRNALANAKENGYGMTDMSDRQVAEDMVDYDSELEAYSVEGVAEAVAIVRGST